ncbi:unnamed protein product, partial [marine sediment metagenome]
GGITSMKGLEEADYAGLRNSVGWEPRSADL